MMIWLVKKGVIQSGEWKDGEWCPPKGERCVNMGLGDVPYFVPITRLS